MSSTKSTSSATVPASVSARPNSASAAAYSAAFCWRFKSDLLNLVERNDVGGARCPSLDRLGTLSEVERATRPMRLGDKPLHLDLSLHYVSLSRWPAGRRLGGGWCQERESNPRPTPPRRRGCSPHPTAVATLQGVTPFGN